ncbi:uncharacterized protein TNCV_3974801 [Trichonephila clavipes]|nr:uncharacterized protein TNCV_3974801 [Trichonephila clavipes]
MLIHFLRIWSEANPQVYVETPLHPEKLTVWCALWAGGIIGPYFFKNDEGHNFAVNGDRQRAMITNFFIPELNNHVQELWFQQDGATCHTARATIDLLKDMFGDRLISRFRPVNWPPRSCDLTPLDHFLWGYPIRLSHPRLALVFDWLDARRLQPWCECSLMLNELSLCIMFDKHRPFLWRLLPATGLDQSNYAMTRCTEGKRRDDCVIRFRNNSSGLLTSSYLHSKD